MSVQEVARGEAGPNKGSEHGGNYNIYMGHKIQKLLEQGGKANAEEKISDIFKGKSVFVNGKPSSSCSSTPQACVIHQIAL